MKKFAKLLFVALLFIMSLCAITACSTNASNVVSVESISILGADSIIKNIQEQYTAVITPSNATDKTVTWEIESGTAEISDSGVLISTETGTVIIKATADGQSTTKQIIVKDTANEPSDPLNATFNGFKKVDDTTYEIKVSNHIESLSIANVATISSDWKLTTDMQAINEIPSKIATPLNIGDNNFYVLVSHQNNVRLYTLKIRRKPIYEVTFNTNDGNFIDTQQIEEDSFISAPTTPTKTGYEFVSWDKEITMPIVADTIFNSIWKAKTYTITYSSNCVMPESQTQKVVFGNSAVLKDKNCFSRSAYDFVKWNTKADNSGTDYSANFNFSNFNIANDIMLYAIWEPVNYSITYNSDGGTHENIITSYNIESPTIALSNAVKIGYSFDGWYTDSEFNNEISSIETGNYGNLELFAKFTANKYIVTLNVDNSDLNQHTIEVTYNQPYELPTPKTEGEWIFKGWDIPTTGIWTWTDKVAITATLTPYYTLVLSTDESCYEIHSYNANKSEIVIPDTYNGLPVAIIRSSAFNGHTALTKVVIPSSVKKIQQDAFRNCRNLTTLILPSSVTYIGSGAFAGCDNLPIVWDYNPSISGKDSIQYYVSKVNLPSDLTEIGDFAFSEFRNLKEIEIPSTVTSIGKHAFQACWNLKSITIPQSISSIEVGTFYLCKNLTEVIIPNNITEIKEFAFYGCNNLSAVFYKGTNVEEWNNIITDENNEQLTGASVYFYSESPIYDGQHWYYDTDNTTPLVWRE